jgi:hypothetical protein
MYNKEEALRKFEGLKSTKQWISFEAILSTVLKAFSGASLT